MRHIYMVSSLSNKMKVTEWLNKLGIKLRESMTEWRNAYDVMEEVGSKWQSFTDIDKSAIATALKIPGALVA